MKKFAAVALVPLFAGFLCAQTDQTTTTTTTTWNGTLIDAGCRTTHTQTKDTSTSNPDENTTRTRTTTTTTEKTECPVTTTTTSFGLMTPEGKYIQFDQPSNTRIVEVVKGNKKWAKYMTDRQPIQVRVVGRPSGDVVVLESIH
jgi:hypothetical protein